MSWLHSVYFLDQNHGWVAGSSGTLLETTDGGTTWNKVSMSTKDNLRDVCFVDDHIGWLVAERDVYKLKTNDEARAYLLRTDDGGLTWRSIYLNSFDVNARLVRMMFADSANGWVFGETGAIFATRDGGASWTRQTPPTKHLLLGGTFLDNSRGWLVGAGATIIRTNDSGCHLANQSRARRRERTLQCRELHRQHPRLGRRLLRSSLCDHRRWSRVGWRSDQTSRPI
jgi:photosystem II stability/assembly factor-like uncharacterized protein